MCVGLGVCVISKWGRLRLLSILVMRCLCNFSDLFLKNSWSWCHWHPRSGTIILHMLLPTHYSVFRSLSYFIFSASLFFFILLLHTLQVLGTHVHISVDRNCDWLTCTWMFCCYAEAWWLVCKCGNERKYTFKYSILNSTTIRLIYILSTKHCKYTIQREKTIQRKLIPHALRWAGLALRACCLSERTTICVYQHVWTHSKIK